jgi:hypothetical protein
MDSKPRPINTKRNASDALVCPGSIKPLVLLNLEKHRNDWTEWSSPAEDRVNMVPVILQTLVMISVAETPTAS